LDKEKKYEEALRKYIESIEYFNHVLKCKKLDYLLDEKNKSLAGSLKSKAEEYLQRAMYLKKHIKEQEEPQKVSASDTPKDGSKGKGYIQSTNFGLEVPRKRRMRTPN